MARICSNPECRIKVEDNENFCPICGCKTVEEVPVKSNEFHQEASAAMPGAALIGEGARVNATGGITQTNTTTHHTTADKIDQSSKIVYNKEKKEFCEICGSPFEEKHARCPKCGKEICLECKVKGKNRCVNCEKQAVKDYEAAFKDVLFASNGNISLSERRMLNQKASELDVEDVKEKVEKEVLTMFKPVQPEVAPVSAGTYAETASTGSQDMAAAKGIGSLAGGVSVKPNSNSGANRRSNDGGNKSGGSKWIFIALLILVAGVAYLFMGGDKESEQPQPSVQQVEQPATTQPASKSASKPATKSSQPVQQTPAAVEQSTTAPAQPTVKKDTSYEAGMKAYEAGNGLDAISAFQKSGSAKAYYMIGVIYENGCGTVGKNAMLARKNFKKAAQMGSSEAKAKL